MTNDEVFKFLREIGFVPDPKLPDGLEKKMGPITLRAAVTWMDEQVAIHGSYRGPDRLADTEGMISRSVVSMLMKPVGQLPKDPTQQDVLDRIEMVLSQLPEVPWVTGLREAIQANRVADVHALLATGKVSPALKLGRIRGSMLHFATSAEMVQMLAEYGVDPNQSSMSGRTPLFEAANLAMIDALFAAGASAAHADREGRTVLHEQRAAKVIKRLLVGGANPNARDKKGREPLLDCEQLPALVSLLSAGADANARDNDGCSVLIRHLQMDRLTMAVLLLAYGADPEQPNAMGETAIFFARSTATLELLLRDYEANVHALSHQRRSALYSCQDADCIRMLCSYGLPAHGHDDEGCTPLHLSRTVGVVRALLENRAYVNAQDDHGRTPLHQAVLRADHNVVAELLRNGASPKIPDARGNTPLHLVRTSAIARRLLQAGADPLALNYDGTVASKAFTILDDSDF